MKEQIKGFLFDLKDIGWTVQKVEKELGFANGSLGKVVSGKAGISDYRFCKLIEFHSEKVGKPATVTEGLKEQIEKNNLHENKQEIEEKRNPPIKNRIQQLMEQAEEELKSKK